MFISVMSLLWDKVSMQLEQAGKFKLRKKMIIYKNGNLKLLNILLLGKIFLSVAQV